MPLRIRSIHGINELHIFAADNMHSGSHLLYLLMGMRLYHSDDGREEAFPLEALSVRLVTAQCVNSW